jgi:hypothetical protein
LVTKWEVELKYIYSLVTSNDLNFLELNVKLVETIWICYISLVPDFERLENWFLRQIYYSNLKIITNDDLVLKSILNLKRFGNLKFKN